MSNILDWTKAALKKKADAAALDGNILLTNVLDNCIEMYEEGLILLTWESGEPYLTLTDEGVRQIERVNEMMGSEFLADDYVIEDVEVVFESDFDDQEDDE